MATLRVVAPAGPGHTAQRRATVALSCLRTHKLSAGDWIRLTADEGKSVVAQAWPSITLLEDQVVLSRSHALALGDPEQVQLERLDVGEIKWMTAKAVTIAVTASKEALKADRGKEREVAWDLALLKEVLRESRRLLLESS